MHNKGILDLLKIGGDSMFKKFSKILLPVFLVALLAFAVTGCGSSGGNSGGGTGGGTAESLDGTYTADIDMTESLSKSSGLDIQTNLAMHIILTLSSGKDYSLALDGDRFVADTKAYYETEMPTLLRQSLINEGYSEEEIEAIVKQQGYASFDEFARSQLDTVLAGVEEQYANKENVLSKGTYSVKGQSISLTDAEHGEGFISDGTIGSDGSLTFEMPVNGEKTTVIFKK